MKIISIGDLVTDYYYKDDKLIGVNGGMTSHNIIANLQKMGHNTKVCGVCGNDMGGNISIKSLEDIGVDVSEVIKKELYTRCFHVSYLEVNDKLEFTSKKRCPFCNSKKWYEESQIDISLIKNTIDYNDIIVIDNLNEKNMEIVTSVSNDIMLDLGQYFEFENKSKEEIIELLLKKFCIIQMNERVEKFLIKKLEIKSLEELYKLIEPKMLSITRGKIGADFVFDDMIIHKELQNVAKEVDSTGAGDAFFACFISEYILNNRTINKTFVDNGFIKSAKLTNKVVGLMGARSHINRLYSIDKVIEKCTCEDFKLKTRKKIKRCNININNLEKRVINALNSEAFVKFEKLFKEIKGTTLFIGTGGSYAGAYFASRVTNQLLGVSAISIYPREVLYRNNNDIDKTFLLSYSGTSSDLLTATKNIDRNRINIISKGEIKKIHEKTGIAKNNIISYKTDTCKGKERGFLAFEGVLAPASLFLKLYMDSIEEDTYKFIIDQMNYWKNYFNDYFKSNKKQLKSKFKINNTICLFNGDYTNSASLDLESKIIESGIYNLNIHEKKNFSHGRFINLEHQKNDLIIYLKQNTTSDYEKVLLKYLNNIDTLIIESKFNQIKAEYDLLIASQYFMHYISNLLDIDISKPTYSDEAMKIYFYKGDL